MKIGIEITLSIEKVWREWRKWAERSIKPSLGLEFLRSTEWVLLYPSLANLVGCPQDPECHPEGDVWQHTLNAVDAAVKIADREKLSARKRVILIFAALCHDMGKPSTTKYNGGRWGAPGHPVAGEVPARSFLSQIGSPKWLVENVIPLVREHMIHLSMGNHSSNKAIRRLANRLYPVTIKDLSFLMEADQFGRALLPVWEGMVYRAKQLVLFNAHPIPILMRRHLIKLEVTPSSAFERILKDAFQCQLDGEFDDLPGACSWAKQNS